MEQETRTRSNGVIAASCLAFFFAMVGMAYAAVPLYQIFCQVTGFGGTTQRASQGADRVLDRQITIRFDANVAGGLPWDFRPAAREIRLGIGETGEAHYRATNLVAAPSRGHATFNVTPLSAGAYFNKIECFCFTDTEILPGETLEMPVVFFVDPDIADAPELAHIETITLSYTFYPDAEQRPRAERASTVNDNAGG